MYTKAFYLLTNEICSKYVISVKFSICEYKKLQCNHILEMSYALQFPEKIWNLELTPFNAKSHAHTSLNGFPLPF